MQKAGAGTDTPLSPCTPESPYKHFLINNLLSGQEETVTPKASQEVTAALKLPAGKQPPQTKQRRHPRPGARPAPGDPQDLLPLPRRCGVPGRLASHRGGAHPLTDSSEKARVRGVRAGGSNKLHEGLAAGPRAPGYSRPRPPPRHVTGGPGHAAPGGQRECRPLPLPGACTPPPPASRGWGPLPELGVLRGPWPKCGRCPRGFVVLQKAWRSPADILTVTNLLVTVSDQNRNCL